MNAGPRVSVVMVARRGGRFLDEALASLQCQTLADIEIVVVAHRSDAALIAQQAEARLRVVRVGQGSIAHCANIGIAATAADVIARLDADDIALPRRLECQLAVLLDHPDVALIGSAADLIDARGAIIGRRDLPCDHRSIVRIQRTRCAFVQSSAMFRRTAFDAAGGYRTGLPLAEDYDLRLRLSERFTVANLPDRLIQYRIHDNNISRRRSAALAACSLCVQAAAQARKDGREESFAHGVPVLRHAASILNITRRQTVCLTSAGGFRIRMFWLLMRMPIPATVKFVCSMVCKTVIGAQRSIRPISTDAVSR